MYLLPAIEQGEVLPEKLQSKFYDLLKQQMYVKPCSGSLPCLIPSIVGLPCKYNEFKIYLTYANICKISLNKYYSDFQNEKEKVAANNGSVLPMHKVILLGK